MKTTVSNTAGADEMLRLPIGHDIFAKIMQRQLDWVDKSLFIKEIIDDDFEVIVITRPRRFGKTLNLSMLHHFLSAEVYGETTSDLFTDLKISKVSGDYLQHQGKYPVIFLTFKDVKDHSFAVAYRNLVNLIADLYKEHRYLLTSPHLAEEDRQIFHEILFQTAEEALIRSSLKNLLRFLYQHHGVKAWLLIDEYDSPLHGAYMRGYYTDMVDLLRSLLGAALKTNPYLERAVITGILRISKESLFSGLNNLRVYSVLSTKYSEYFGFTEAEVSDLLQRADLPAETAPQIREWYNGYQIGKTVIYNPWSIVNCIHDGGLIRSYWVNTSDNQLIKELLTGSSEQFRTQFEDLLLGKPLAKIIDENMVFGDLKKNEKAAWSLLLMSGYLKVIAQHDTDFGIECDLAIPNREVRGLYRQIIESWLANGYGVEWFKQFLEHLLSGDIAAFATDLRHLIDETFSVHDTSKDPEVFYHGFMVGATASLYRHPNYELKSNRESGYGRYDYLIFSHDLTRPTIILEIKRVTATEKKTTADLDALLKQTATQALMQIQQQQYLTEARQRGRTKLLKIALAFSGKHFNIQTEEES